MTSSEKKEPASSLTQTLLNELKESQTEFIAIRFELDFLSENVKSLSKILRDGNGDSSVLTRIALLNQKIDDLVKWKETHHQTHISMIADYQVLHNEIEELEKGMLLIEKDVRILNQKAFQGEQTALTSLQKEAEISQETKLSKAKIAEERQKAIIKVVSAIILTILTFLAGWFSND